VLVILAAGLASPAAAPAAEADYFTYLTASSDFSGARGDSEYEREGTKREVEVTVSGISRLAGQRVGVYVDGRKVGTMRVSTRGRAHREWSTSHGRSVPSARAGSSLRVRTAGGTLIASGTDRLDNDGD
jgi:hypothetical protein